MSSNLSSSDSSSASYHRLLRHRHLPYLSPPHLPPPTLSSRQTTTAQTPPHKNHSLVISPSSMALSLPSSSSSFSSSAAFAKHQQRQSLDKVQRWKNALKEAANLSGFHSSGFKPESVLIDAIVLDVLKRLNDLSSSKRSRLWHHEDICHVLTKNTGSEKIEGISLNIKVEQLWNGYRPLLKLEEVKLGSSSLISCPDFSDIVEGALLNINQVDQEVVLLYSGKVDGRSLVGEDEDVDEPQMIDGDTSQLIKMENINKTINDWWLSKLEVHPGAAKFRKEGIDVEMEAKLDRMFMNIIATGDYAWAHSSGVLPSKDCQILDDDHVIPLDLNNLIQIKSEDGEGKYYPVDVGYPQMDRYLRPYKGERYHLPDFRRGSQPTGHQEVFNHAHSSLKSVIERTFGVWKKRWKILRDMSSYPFDKQVKIVIATMAIHNYIRRHAKHDHHFEKIENDPDFILEEDNERDDDFQEENHNAKTPGG
ncbi:hypothetical protein QYF36_001915 [Acer negundo]|nr:hypothetical protein QYF36_001915 [Acer negundo]